MPYVEDFNEFKARQNCEFIQLDDGSYVFENGATCMVHIGDGFHRLVGSAEPPTERFALLRARRLFVHARLGMEAKAYESALSEYKQASANAARFPNVPPVPAAAMQSLRVGWDRVEALRQRLEKIDQQLDESPEAVLKRQRQQQDQAIMVSRQHTATLFGSITSITQPPPKSENIVDVVDRYFQSTSNP